MTDNKKEKPVLLGPDRLTAKQIQQMPQKERHKYISQMTAKEYGKYMTAGMVGRMNSGHSE